MEQVCRQQMVSKCSEPHGLGETGPRHGTNAHCCVCSVPQTDITRCASGSDGLQIQILLGHVCDAPTAAFHCREHKPEGEIKRTRWQPCNSGDYLDFITQNTNFIVVLFNQIYFAVCVIINFFMSCISLLSLLQSSWVKSNWLTEFWCILHLKIELSWSDTHIGY